MKKEKKTKNIIKNSGNMGSAVIGGDAKVKVTFTASDIEQLPKDVEKAHEIINESNELNEKQKAKLCGIISDTQEGVEENSEEKTAKIKQRFEDFVDGLGDSANKVVSALSKIETIGKFFGIG